MGNLILCGLWLARYSRYVYRAWGKKGSVILLWNQSGLFCASVKVQNLTHVFYYSNTLSIFQQRLFLLRSSSKRLSLCSPVLFICRYALEIPSLLSEAILGGHACLLS
jgi:hypothetical protein